MARHPGDGNEAGNVDASAAALVAEVEALRHRLAALEARLPGNALHEPLQRLCATKSAAPVAAGAVALDPDASARVARRRALGLGVLASLLAFIGRSSARAADALTINPNGEVNIDRLSVQSSLAVAGPMTIAGKNTLEFGAGVEGKDASAGTIGYQRWTPDSLDIVGAGHVPNRKITFIADGGATMGGSLTVRGDATFDKSLRAASLAVAGPATIAGNNTLEFGAGVNNKHVNSGKIGYQLFTADALDIVGAGTSDSTHKLNPLCGARSGGDGARLRGALLRRLETPAGAISRAKRLPRLTRHDCRNFGS